MTAPGGPSGFVPPEQASEYNLVTADPSGSGWLAVRLLQHGRRFLELGRRGRRLKKDVRAVVEALGFSLAGKEESW